MDNKIRPIPIKEIKKQLNDVKTDAINTHFVPFFEKLKDKYILGTVNSKPKIKVFKLEKIEDFDNEVFDNSIGFYVILTDYKNGYDDNECTMRLKGDDFKNVKAIYRGEGGKVKLRLMSHLFNNTYVKDRMTDLNNKKKRPDNYVNCLKLVGKENKQGINIDEEELSQANWYIAFHTMSNSNQDIRKLAEEAFDIVFGKPICSRENNNSDKKGLNEELEE
ncbi:hypothetical protein FH508_0013140 [Lysinibacillus sp. CD3-6]|uniref:hypothetical protein n=1 Tax=Lysinibacillus sp. CD3-6 TaxID=2892541 RepID=UPI0011749052|nr:hypothetical protein [Lysinibacillus sp. CD3-6]UED78411.1 hypothetical protein FH508_0013140 [Lysinibacillus sp. CD3-6]